MKTTKQAATIPDGVVFSDLQLARNPDTGDVSFDWAPIEKICAANNIPIEQLRDGHEDNVAGMIVAWYSAHLSAGGAHDPVADDLIAEVRAEDAAGQAYSHQPGRA